MASHLIRFLMLALLAPQAAMAGPSVVVARGQWATLQQGRTCEAAARSILPARKDHPQARASLSFDAGGPRHGQLTVRLSRAARPGASVMLVVGSEPFLLIGRADLAWSRGPAQEAAIVAAIRSNGGMRVESRGRNGGRVVDRYSLDGAPLAIDSAAACAARLANR